MSKDIVNELLSSYGNRICRDVKRTWQSLPHVKGKANISFKVVKNEDELTIGRIEATGQKAWLVEYGKGSLMASETNNPYLERYKKNPRRWNSVRKGSFVTGRKAGTYYDLDNKKYISGGLWEGRNMEYYYKPMKPEYVIHKAVTDDNASKLLFKHQLKKLIKKEFDIEVTRR